MSTTNVKPSKLLADIIHHMKYARYLPQEKRRELYEETVLRNMMMHVKRFPHLTGEIVDAYTHVFDKQVLPSMRSLQFAGPAIDKNHARIFNCSFCHINHPKVFHEIMFLLLSGCGVGYSVQRQHVNQLPTIKYVEGSRVYEIEDSIEGWAYAVDELMSTFFEGKPYPQFIFDQIRPAGSPIVTSGGVAPGPEPLRKALRDVSRILKQKQVGSRLTPLECYDILCHFAYAVLAGGVRRSSFIALFSIDDHEMQTCKSGEWWTENPQRALANNSVVVLRKEFTYDVFEDYWNVLQESGSGEPNIFQTNDLDVGSNPSLRRGTKILTANGVFPIEDLNNQYFRVRNIHGKWSQAQCWLSGRNKPLYAVTLESGKVYHATAEHKWPILKPDGLYEKVTTTELQPGMYLPRLRVSSLFEGEVGDYDDGINLGWLYGDPSHPYSHLIGESSSPASRFMSLLYGKCKQIDPNKAMSFNDMPAEKYFDQFGLVEKKDGLPRIIWEEGTEALRRGFLGAIYTCGGSFKKDSPKIIFRSQSSAFAEELSELLWFYGIRNNVHHSCDDCGVGESFVTISQLRDIQQFRELVSPEHVAQKEILASYQFGDVKEERDDIRIVAVEKTDLCEDVWDINVSDDTHCFQLSHCVTGNCGEISLQNTSFCNLVEINAATIHDQGDLNRRAQIAARLATLQATYTDFPLLRKDWSCRSQEEALIGVGMTGIAAGTVMGMDLAQAAKIILEENRRMAALLGINIAQRTTTVKPSGTTSLALGNGVPVSSGVHGYWDRYYLRRVIVTHTEPLYTFLRSTCPWMLEPSVYRPETESVITIPLKAPDSAITRDEGALSLLSRVKKLHSQWIVPGHRGGANTNNVSVTIPVREHEWDLVKEWWWKNKESFVSITLLPSNGGNYKQLPFESCSVEDYERRAQQLREVDFSKIVEMKDTTSNSMEAACAGGVCELV